MKEVCSTAPLVEARRDGRLGPREIASLERHLLTCPSCAALSRRLARIADHLRQPPAPPPSPLSEKRTRAALLRAAAAGSGPPRDRRPAGALVLALIALTALAARWTAHREPPRAVLALRMPAIPRPAAEPAPPPPAARLSTVVHPSEGARFEHPPTLAGVERIHLAEGSLDLEVRKLAPGERFLVVTADAEVEVRGTVFRVQATGDRIVAVSVQEGKVEIRHLGESALVPAGGTWKPPREEIRPPKPTPTPPAARPAGGRETSRDFSRAMALIERGDYAAAAERLSAFQQAHPADARAEDAAYLTILSLQRAGQAAAAADAARRFLAIYPRSPRRAAVQQILDP